MTILCVQIPNKRNKVLSKLTAIRNNLTIDPPNENPNNLELLSKSVDSGGNNGRIIAAK